MLVSAIRASLVAHMVKRLSTTQETWVWSLGWEDPLEKEMAIHSSTIAWKIPWTEEPGRLQSMGSQRVGHDWAISLSLFCHTLAWIGHRYTYAPSLLNPLPAPTPSPPSRLSQSPSLSSPSHAANSHWLSVLHMVMYTFPCYSLKSSLPLHPPPGPQVCSLCL